MLYITPGIHAFLIAVAFVLGGAVASFANCAALRRMSGESVMRGRSRCPYCHTQLSAVELVPIASWLVQKGACRHCGADISLRYPITELIGACMFALLMWRIGPTLECVQYMAFSSILLYCSLVDLDSWTIPNAAIVAAIAVRAIYIVCAGLFLKEDVVPLAARSIVGGVAIGGALLAVVLIADKVLGRESMGGGDLKLFFVAGLYFGWQQCLFLVIIACVSGIVMALFRGQGRPEEESLDQGRSNENGDANSSDAQEEPMRHRQIPFGPAIAFACFAIMLFGDDMVAWYERLFL